MNEPVNYHPITGLRFVGTPPTLAMLRTNNLDMSWPVDPWTGRTRSEAERKSDPRMELEYPTPGPTTHTLAQVRQLHRDLEADILALLIQFERNTGVSVSDVDTHSVCVTTIESPGLERRTSRVRVSVVL